MKTKVESIKDAQRLNDSLLENSLALSATEGGVNNDHKMENRERKIERERVSKKKARK